MISNAPYWYAGMNQSIPPLPIVPGDGVYSVRKANPAYVGGCMKVRRSSDDTELIIGFQNNELDQAALLAFVGAGNGFVSIWYSQVALFGDLVQASLVKQPQIVANGAIIMQNGKPAVYQASDTKRLSLASTVNLTTNYIMSAVINYSNDDTEFIGTGASNSYGWYRQIGITYHNINGNFGNTAFTIPLGSQILLEWYRTGILIPLYYNSNLQLANANMTGNVDFNFKDLSGEAGFGFVGYIQEVILKPSIPTPAQRQAIQLNVNNYFNIW